MQCLEIRLRKYINICISMTTVFLESMGNHVSLDEAIEPYYGHQGLKQFIRGKPIRYAFKFRCFARPDGFLVKFHSYTGAGDKIAGKTLGSSVTEKLYLKFVPVGSRIYMDNCFTSLPLIDALSNNGLFCVGTIQKDRTENAPLQEALAG
ncbi:piggyBac transposable element-derived protein 3-like [Octopus bimaculoides]|uniref:piggyBac transposable element-derived protein 3-like n=1 Tax=Octopus bimaculoides TaxID=37653 RepID=UPI00071E42FA|nr:piggyBac transposable element-derived protein 3-like [Octopus bimaculoides]|eukprot:XP_014772150.1 PREDICTED: piggyBac transposable element-derived protein 3-like [Octopus bimaculoides]